MQLTNLLYATKRPPYAGYVFALIAVLWGPQLAHAQDPFCSLSCNNLVSTTIDATCSTTIPYGMILEGEESTDACFPLAPTDFMVVLSLEKDGPAYDSDNPDLVTGSEVGELFFAKVTHIPTGVSCSGRIFIEDNRPPTIVCPPAIVEVECGEDTDVAATGDAVVMDCYEVVLFSEDQVRNVEADCNDFVTEITRTFVALSASGKTASCSHTIKVKRLTIADVDFPADHIRDPNDPPNGLDSAIVDCATADIDPSNTGFPEINGTPISLMNGLCGISITYRDNTIDGCGNNMTIIRTWTVVDKCAERRRDQIETHEQTILVMDMEGPMIDCPEKITVGTNVLTACAADITMPEVTVTDNCSGVASIEMIVNGFDKIESNGGLVENLPEGLMNEITYVAEDNCGRFTECITIVEVIDMNGPSVACEDEIVVTLSDLGGGTLSVDAMVKEADDDCCSRVVRETRRMDGTDADYGDEVAFTCADAGQVLTIINRVTDCNDNSTICMVMVTVSSDIIGPLTCPDATTVSCLVDFDDPNETGLPTVGSICGDISNGITFSDDLSDLTLCGTGTITRTFSVEFADGTPAMCTQIITVGDDENGITVTFPDDYTFNQCVTLDDLEPDDLPLAFQRPVVNGVSNCNSIEITFTDSNLSSSPGACMSLVRTWTVIDRCLFDMNPISGEGIFVETQTIFINDTDDPVLTCPSANRIVQLSPFACTATVVLNNPIVSGECFSGQVNFTYISNLGANQNAQSFTNVGPGSYFATIIATDNCGNSSECDVRIEVEDNNRPTANCRPSLTVPIQPGGSAEILPADINNSSSDACDGQALNFRIETNPIASNVIPPLTTSLVATCSDIGSNFTVTLWVGDSSENWERCETVIQVTDPDNNCSPGLTVGMLAGLVEAPSGVMVENVEVSLENEQEMGTVMTNRLGYYMFPEVALSDPHRIMPDRGTAFNEGVSTFDLVKLMLHLTGKKLLLNPYEQIAADVSGDDNITILDAIIMQRIILNLQKSVDKNRSWRFVPKNYQFIDPQNALANPFPEYIDILGMEGDYEDANFIGVKVGDINMSFDPALSGSTAGSRSDDAQLFTIQAEDRVYKAGATAVLALEANQFEDIAGVQFGLNIDPQIASIAGVQSPLFEQGFQHRELEAGNLILSGARMSNFSPSGAQLVLVELRMHQDARLSEFIQVNSSLISSELIFRDEMIFEKLHIDWIANGVINATVSPNPFINRTNIELNTAETESLQWTIFNTEGKLLSQGQLEKGPGSVNLPLDASHFEGSGVYLFRVKGNSGTKVIKIIQQ